MNECTMSCYPSSRKGSRSEAGSWAAGEEPGGAGGRPTGLPCPSARPAVLYQEYSDVASARELRRQQREEEGPGDEVEGAEEGPGPPRANLSPSSSFRAQRSARGSTFSLWQDIPDVRGSGVLATLSLRDCKLQEVGVRAGGEGRRQRGWGSRRGGPGFSRAGATGVLRPRGCKLQKVGIRPSGESGATRGWGRQDFHCGKRVPGSEKVGLAASEDREAVEPTASKGAGRKGRGRGRANSAGGGAESGWGRVKQGQGSDKAISCKNAGWQGQGRG